MPRYPTLVQFKTSLLMLYRIAHHGVCAQTARKVLCIHDLLASIMFYAE